MERLPWIVTNAALQVMWLLIVRRAERENRIVLPAIVVATTLQIMLVTVGMKTLFDAMAANDTTLVIFRAALLALAGYVLHEFFRIWKKA